MTTIFLVIAAFLIGHIVGKQSGLKLGISTAPLVLMYERLHLENALHQNATSPPTMEIEIRCGRGVRRCTVQEAAQRARLIDDTVHMMNKAFSM